MLRSLVGVVALLSSAAFAADCKVAVVGKPHSGCWDIANAAGITTTQLSSWNPGLNCNLLQPDQRLCISSGTLPDISPKPNPDGSCATHKVVKDSGCAAIASKYGITVANIETYNKNTYKWKGCGSLQADAVICVSSGKPPPIPINPNLQCGPESKGNAECPLKACCSAYGFCGLTDAFCKTAPNGDPCISNCGQPTPKTCGSNLKRKIGYYAGWGSRRPCDKVFPENLDLEGYTDVIFAFATITQSNEITIESADDKLLRDVVALKSRYSGLKVTIAIGGWAFSMDNPTQSLFSVMISSSANRSKFINSCKSFMTKYGLDGIDIDMEYPAAMERNGPAVDTPNLTAFFKEAKAALSGKIVSVAAPAGYWFLKGFQIDKVVDHVDYINMMSYDFHGAWDLIVDDEDGTAKPHTSSEDIMDAIKLYTRAKVDLSKVNLGMAWYGRTYAVGGCKGTSCKFTAGGKAGKCTGEASIKSQTEIWDEIKANNIKPTYDTKTNTYWYNHNSDFVSYDDTESWKHKTEMAGKYCFGGTFVWSLDLGKKHDPLPPKPDIDVKCTHKVPDNDFRTRCLNMVKGIKDSDENKDCTSVPGFAGEHAYRPFCSGECCLNIAMNKFSDVKVKGREIKQAALEILGACHGADIGRRSVELINGTDENQLEKRFIPIPILVTITGWAVLLFEGLMTIFFMDSEEDQRGEYVTEAVAEARKLNPEYNMIMVHPKHLGWFEEPCFHAHYEFNRPIFGTIGYELYYVRKGNFTLRGDGGFLNWAYSGYFEGDSKDKFLKINAPGAAYGRAGPFTGYTSSNTAVNGLTVSLSSPDGCGTSMGVNNGDNRNYVRCTDIDVNKAKKMAEGFDLPEGDFVEAPPSEHGANTGEL